MTVRIEWHQADAVSAEAYPPMTTAEPAWVGHPEQGPGEFALTISTDEVAAIHGTLPELRELAARITAAIDDAAAADAAADAADD